MTLEALDILQDVFVKKNQKLVRKKLQVKKHGLDCEADSRKTQLLKLEEKEMEKSFVLIERN